MLELRPLAEADLQPLRAIAAQPESRRWGWSSDDVGGDEDATQFAVVVDGEVAGLIQYGEEEDPDYRHAWIDVFLDRRVHGRGIGSESVRRMVALLMDERGHHRVTIDPATDNHVAIRAYEKAGFRPVGVMQAAWRDPDGEWRDALLMETVRLR